VIRLTSAAEAELASLVSHYARLGRDRAIDRLVDSIEIASARFEHGRGVFYPAPRPYPVLSDLGFSWTKEGPYWIAFEMTADGPVIAAIFHDTADIPNRI
jgi:plasmid stabilization system protein ParE